MKASIVVGLGFGDEGKGKVTDYLCSQYSNDSIVIRYCGGPQAAHNVVLENGQSHIHSNFGSGTLRGIVSYFSEHCCIYINTLVNEYYVLVEKGAKPNFRSLENVT